MSIATDFAEQIKLQLARPLPGEQAMRAWAPQLAYGRHFVPPPANARQSAVAVLIYPREGEWFVPLTLRPATLTHHASQVSFPGGSLDNEETAEEAAWRELSEELGIAREELTPIGRLTPLFIFASNFFVVPCVAFARETPLFVPNPSEVEAVLELPLSNLVATPPDSLTIQRGELCFRAPCWQAGGQRIWGASAMILGELAAVVELARR